LQYNLVLVNIGGASRSDITLDTNSTYHSGIATPQWPKRWWWVPHVCPAPWLTLPYHSWLVKYAGKLEMCNYKFLCEVSWVLEPERSQYDWMAYLWC